MADNIEDYPFGFMNIPSSLQLLASSKIALTLWQYKYSNSTDSTLSSFLSKNFSCEDDMLMVVPPRFAVKIDEEIATIRAELKKWIDFHGKRGFFDGDFREAFAKSLKLMVVDSCGGICHKGTAKNILDSRHFNNVEKYKLACEFCFEAYVKKLWRSVSKDARIGENPDIDKHSLMFYWNRRMKSRKSTIKDTLSVKTRLENTRKASNWPAFAYFWNTHSTDREKSALAVTVVKRGNDEAIKLALPPLNRILVAKVFEDTVSQILPMLIPNEKYFQHVHRFWTVVEHTVYEKESRLFQVLYELWKMVYNPIDIRLRLNYARCEQINEFLNEIWSKASDTLKYDISNHHVSDFFNRLSACSSAFPSCYGHNMDFMLDLLSKWRNLNKEQIWHKNWRKLILRAKPVYLKQFLRVCLSDDEDVEKFKKQLLASKRIFELLIKHGMYSDLKYYLSFCTKDETQFKLQSKKLLRLHSHLIVFHDDGEFAKFDQFVAELFSNVRKDIETFKFTLISMPKNLNYLHKAFTKDPSTDFKAFKGIVGRFASSQQKLKSLKGKLLNHCREYLTRSQSFDFKVDQYQELIEWCCADVEEIAAFKRSLNVDAIFLQHLGNLRRYYYVYVWHPEKCFQFFDGFSRWYFDSEADMRNFKLQKIANYEQLADIRAMLVTPAYRSAMYSLLNWFFDKDAEKVREFCRECNFSPPS